MRKVKYLFAFLIAAYIFASFAVSAQAKEYLFKFKEGAGFPVTYISEARLQNEDILTSALGIYKTDDLYMLLEYQRLGLLEFFEENGEAELLDMPSPSDYMSIASGVPTSTVPLGYSYNQIGLDALWELGFTGKGITVAVIDSGANAHVDIADNLLQGYNFSLTDEEIAENPDAVYTTRDIHEHGTMVSGLIAANGDHYKGVAYEAKIVPLKCFRDSDGRADLDVLARAMVAAVDEFQCDIINMSCGTSTNSKAILEAVNYVHAKGIPVIAAAGNSGSSYTVTDAYYYPAAYPSAVSVANLEKNDSLKSSSQKNDMVDVSAPGTYIYGLSGSVANGYLMNSGTSFSCPIVTGVAALMLQARPDLDDVDIQSLLQSTATDLGDVGKDVKFGYGKVNCAAIVPKLLDNRIYTSNVVEYRGTYNIAIRNGVPSDYTDFVAFATYSGGKMSSIDILDIPLAYGERHVFSAPTGGEVRLFKLEKKSLMPRTAAVGN